VADLVAVLVDELTRARRGQDATRVAVAAVIGVTPAAVAGWEHGRDLPSAWNFILWARALGFTVVVVDETGAVHAARLVPHRAEPPGEYRMRCIARVLRDVRQEADLTQGQIGERLGVSVWTIQMWEGAQRVPRLVRLFEWCGVLGCRLELRDGRGRR